MELTFNFSQIFNDSECQEFIESSMFNIILAQDSFVVCSMCNKGILSDYHSIIFKDHSEHELKMFIKSYCKSGHEVEGSVVIYHKFIRNALLLGKQDARSIS